MSSNFHKDIVPAMDMLIGDPDVLTPTAGTKKKADCICIPYQYVDRLGSWRHEMSSRGEAAKQLIRSFGNMLVYLNNHQGTKAFTCENGMKIQFFDIPAIGDSSTTNAIQLAKKLLADPARKSSVAIMTGSDWMVAQAAAAHIDVARINPEIYTGRCKVHLPNDAISLWTRQHRILQSEWENLFPRQPLHLNEFVEFSLDNYGQVNSGYKNIGRFTYDENGELAVIPLKYTKFISPSYRGIHPITNVQAMYMEALLAPTDEIPIVIFSGLFGTGKTFMPIAAGLNGVGYRTSVPNLQLERIFVCPRDSALGKDIGFLPGGVTDKVMAKALPIIDNIRDVLKIIDGTPTQPEFTPEQKRVQKLVDSLEDAEPELVPTKSTKKRDRKRSKTPHNESAMKRPTASGGIEKRVMEIVDRYFEFQPLINMGGRSISNSLIFYDEFQDVERFQARELVSRIGNGSKMVIAGDPTQLSNPHLNRTSNGLTYLATKLADKPYAAVISSENEDEIVRHWVLREVAKALSN